MIIYPDLCACLEFMETYGNPKFHGSSSLSPCICYDHELWYPPQSQQPNILIAQSHVEPKQVCLKTGTPKIHQILINHCILMIFYDQKSSKYKGCSLPGLALGHFDTDQHQCSSQPRKWCHKISQNDTRWPGDLIVFGFSMIFPSISIYFNASFNFIHPWKILGFYISKRHLFWICLALK